MLKKGWIHPIMSPYRAPILFMCKTMGELRMFVDFWHLNCQTRPDMSPILHSYDLLDKLGRARIFSAFNLLSAYHWVHIMEWHEHCTLFLMLMGLNEYSVMPQGLANVPAMFKYIMN